MYCVRCTMYIKHNYFVHTCYIYPSIPYSLCMCTMQCIYNIYNTIKQYICCDNCFSEYKVDTSSDRRFNIAVSRNKSTLLILTFSYDQLIYEKVDVEC